MEGGCILPQLNPKKAFGATVSAHLGGADLRAFNMTIANQKPLTNEDSIRAAIKKEPKQTGFQ